MTHSHTDEKNIEITKKALDESESTKNKPKIEMGRIVFYGVITGFLLVFVGLSATVYSLTATSPVVRAITSVLPYPAYVIGNEVITYGEFLTEFDSLAAYFNSIEEEANKNLDVEVTEALINKIATQHLAVELSIELDPERETALFKQVLYGLSGEDELAVELEQELGWTIDEFKERVVQPIALATQINEFVLNDEEIQAERRSQADEAYQQVIDGESFDTVSGEVAGNFELPVWKDKEFEKLSAYPTDWQTIISELEIGDITEPFNADATFVIARLDEKIEAGDDTEVKLSLIAIPKIGLEDTLDEYLEEIRIWRLIRKI